MNIGKHGEEIAAQEYFKKGYRLLATNVRMHLVKQVGEIDLIVTKDRVLVFVEVKTRTNFSYGLGAEAVNYYKQRKLIQAVRLFLAKNKQYRTWVWRIDVVEVYLDSGQNSVIILENVVEDLD